MTVGDIMTRKVVSCRKDTDVGTAARLMLVGRFGALPVVDSHGRVAGIITDRDIAMATATRQRNASYIAVHEAMTEKVRTCVADDEIGAALKQMEAARVRRLPVVDTASQLVGILSLDDIIQRAPNHTDDAASMALIEALRRIYSQPAVAHEPTIATSS
jgi:CBS domain-containing protein